jgi:Amt family ammonium transporter
MHAGKVKRILWSLAALVLLLPATLFAQEEAGTELVSQVNAAYHSMDNMWLLIAAVLVFFMQAGFAMVEAGLNATRNVVNILFKNVMDANVGILLYFLIGYGLMYPGDAFSGGFFGFAGMGVPNGGPADAFTDATAGALNPQIDFLFQAVFAATAATIVSGAVAGRMKFSGYLMYSAVLTGLIYPISGMWKWGGGWLDAMGFYDFAGSILVHAVGGFAGLAGAIALGPRIGKFSPEGKPQAIPGHNLPIATLGVFILWFGWYGFNPGSQLAIAGAGNTHAVMLIATNTTLAAAAGGTIAMILTWVLFKKPELSMTLNGILGGLVGITANCDSVTNVEAIIIGLIAGVVVVAGVKLLDILKIDDPVGAFPVHGLAGVWGGIATGIFGLEKDLMAQIVGSIVVPLYAFVAMLAVFMILKVIGQLRVSREHELKGMDITEHGEEAYKGFAIFTLD